MTFARMQFVPARGTRSFDDVVEQIRNAVLDGRIKQGERLPNERDLCRLFRVSRSTLREGLRTLEVLGVVEIRPGSAGGIFASEPRGDQVSFALEALLRFQGATAHDLAEFRVAFEAETAYWAAVRADPGDVAEICSLAAEFRERASDRDAPWQELAGLDVRFHEAVVGASKNQVRVAIMLGISKAFLRTSGTIEPLASPAVRRSIAEELAGVAEAIAAGDPKLARSRMQKHVRRFSGLGSRIEQEGSTLRQARPGSAA